MASLFITAFGPFEGVGENPSEALLDDLVAKCESPKRDTSIWKLIGHKVLPVSAREAEFWLQDELYTKLLSKCETRPVVVHLGVDVKATEFRLETYALNDASFRQPDVAGWQPENQPIDPALPLGSRLMTDVPVTVVKGLLDSKSVPVQQSFDAGRYVCNWTYYNSLRLAARAAGPRPHVIFLHVPPFEAVGREAQGGYLETILEEIVEVAAGVRVTERHDLLSTIDQQRIPSLLRVIRS